MLLEPFLPSLYSFVEISAGAALSFALFRIPIQMRRIIPLGIIITIMSIICQHIAPLTNFTTLVLAGCGTAYIHNSYRLPLLYSICVSIMAALTISLSETLMIWLLAFWPTSAWIAYKKLVASVFISAIIAYLQYRKIGFLINESHWSSERISKRGMIYFSILLLIIISLLQILDLSDTVNSAKLIIFTGLAVIFLVGMLLLYKRNIKLLRDKYGVEFYAKDPGNSRRQKGFQSYHY